MISMVLWGIGLASLWLGAWLDWRGRSVPNNVWLWAALIAAPFVLAEAFHSLEAWAWRMGTAVIITGLAFFLWYGRVLGAGDSKGIMLAGLTMSPWDYWNPDAASFVPIIDALIPALILAEAWRRTGRMTATPFLVVLAPLATATVLIGGLLWWPIVWLKLLLS